MSDQPVASFERELEIGSAEGAPVGEIGSLETGTDADVANQGKSSLQCRISVSLRYATPTTIAGGCDRRGHGQRPGIVLGDGRAPFEAPTAAMTRLRAVTSRGRRAAPRLVSTARQCVACRGACPLPRSAEVPQSGLLVGLSGSGRFLHERPRGSPALPDAGSAQPAQKSPSRCRCSRKRVGIDKLQMPAGSHPTQAFQRSSRKRPFDRMPPHSLV